MAGLTRKFLTALGIEESKADQIIEQHTAVTDELKQERDNYKTQAEKAKNLEADLSTTKNELEALKKAAGENPFEKKYNDLKKEFDGYKADVDAKETKRSKEKAYKSMLRELGISDKRIDSIVKVTDISKVELEQDGTLKSKDDLEKSAREEWSEFIPTKTQVGAGTKNPPTNNAKSTNLNDLYKTDEKGRLVMSDKERFAAIAESLKE